MKYLSVLILTGVLACNCARHETRLETIISYENQRAPCDSLVSLLGDSEPLIRARAVSAIGKLQDPACRSEIENSLSDKNHNVRIEAAFALGQIGDSLAEAALTARLKMNDRVDIKTRVVEALGKIGTEKRFPIMMKLFKHEKADIRGQAALSIGRMALRKLTNQNATTELARLLRDGNSEVRWKAAWAFTRIEKDTPEEPLLDLLADTDSRVRMFAALALGQMQSLRAIDPVARLLKRDPDWRVRVNAARALGNYPLNLAANYLILFDKNVHVRTAIIQAIGSSAKKDSSGYSESNRDHNLARNRLEDLFMSSDTSSNILEQGTALISYAQLIGPDAADKILPFMDSKHSLIRIKAVQALVETRAQNISAIFDREFTDALTPVQIAMLSQMPNLNNPGNRVYAAGLESNDPVVVALAARGLADDSLKAQPYVTKISEACSRVLNKLDAETAEIIFDAMARFGDDSAIPVLFRAARLPQPALASAANAALVKLGQTIPPDSVNEPLSKKRFSYADLGKLENAKAVIQTRRGDITIRLFPDDAPFTVLSFVRLAEKGFFDGLNFHRVVPNFVIQGGDPRGDGWGSPGYAIRSEFNKRHYERGTVGMASAGKDTEGCQFFITHSPQPHLDGRYTVFGQVIAGMDVVDAIQPEDQIQRILVDR